MPNVFDHLLFGVLIAIFPIWAVTYGFRRLQAASEADVPRVRRSIYRWAMLLQWTLVAAMVALWVREHRLWSELGLLPRLSYGLIGVGAGLLIVVPMIIRQRQKAMVDDEAMESVRRRLGHLERMLPHTREELVMFSLLSITAGICEEVLYRGYLIWYLSHWVGLITAAGVAAVFFGLGHAYQGARGMIQTGLVGAFLAAVYLLSGSLIASMLIHAFMDLHAGQLAYGAYGTDRHDAPALAPDDAIEPGFGEPDESSHDRRDASV